MNKKNDIHETIKMLSDLAQTACKAMDKNVRYDVVISTMKVIKAFADDVISMAESGNNITGRF